MLTRILPLGKTRDHRKINFLSPFSAIKNHLRIQQAGFSLIEIMVVLGIIGSMIALGISQMKKPKESIKTVAREMAILGKEIRNHSRLFNKTLRLVIDFKENTGSYWIESAPTQGTFFIDTEKAERQRKGELVDIGSDGKPKSEFQKYSKLLKKDRDLPKGLKFKQLETQSLKEPVTEGKGYIYFFPDGHLEASALQITDGKDMIWTILLHPLTGEAEIVKKELSLRDYKK